MKNRSDDEMREKLIDDSTGSHEPESHSKKFFKIFGILIGALTISALVLAWILLLKSNGLCVTPSCARAANYLIESIDETVDPCEDFYHFVCGKWMKNTRIPDGVGATGILIKLQTQLQHNIVDLLTSLPINGINEPKAIINARILYQSCINEQNIEAEDINPILSLIDAEFGGWPILRGSSWNNSTFDLLNLLLKLREYNDNIIFDVGTSTGGKYSTEYHIQIGQSTPGLGQRQYYSSDSKTATAYQKLFHDLVTSLSNDTSMVEQDIKDIFAFENQIAQHYWTSAGQRAEKKKTIQTTLSNLSSLLNSSFDFATYLRRTYLWAGVPLVDSDIVTVSEVEYLYNVSAILGQTSSRTLQNYIVWRFMMHQIDNMPKRFRILKEKVDRISRGTTAKRLRAAFCGNFVNTYMGFAVSKLYIKKYFDEHARIQLSEMIGNIREAFIDMLNQSTWMDDVSKSKAVEKAQAIGEKIGYPDYLTSDNVTELENQYAEYIFNSSFINNVLILDQIKAREEFQILRKPVDRKKWGFLAPTVVNAFYSGPENQITLPAAILQMPLIDKDAPKYLNYGSIGGIIGHEITHGFDNTGRQFDKDGNEIRWWTDETIEKFNERQTCIIDQYSNYTVPNTNITLDGKQTQDENIADNGGLRGAFYAYQKWTQNNNETEKRLSRLSKYSSEQMFFINYAHTWCSKMTDGYALAYVSSSDHSLEQFRVIGSTSNFVEFDRAFNCKQGQGNSRVKKCTVW